MEEEKKYFEFAQKLTDAVKQVFDEDSEFYIPDDDIEKYSNDFGYALLNLMPAYIYAILAGEQADLLKINHIANRLCFQYKNK